MLWGSDLSSSKRGVSENVNKLFSVSVSIHARADRGNLYPRAIRDARHARAKFCRAVTMAGALALFVPLAASAQSNAIPARITAPINESALTTLRGNTHPLARAQYDQGAVADSQPMRRMLLLLQRSPEQETALRTLIDQQQSKSSANFHQWLTPQQFGQQYGPATSDIQAVTNWLQSHGFQIARVATGGMLIEFSGTAGQVLNAFHTQIHRYVVNGEEHLANSTDPQIPSALAPVVAGPVSLHNFPRKAQNHIRGAFQKDKTTGKVSSIASPSFTFPGTSCTTNAIFPSSCYALGPGDFAAIYNVNPLWNTGINSHVIDGTGQTIAIVGDSEICTASSPDYNTCTRDDVADFRNLFGLSATLPTVILDGPDPGFNGDEIEGDLDVQWSGAVAKSANIDFVIAEATEASAGTDLAAEYIVDNNLAPVMSESFGYCEAFLLAGGNLFESSLWEQAAAQGITVVVSTGDSGSAGCDDQNLQTSAVNGANVNGIASTPFNVAAGGTDFDTTATNYPAAFWSATNSSANGVENVSALGYIPETTWNDSCARTGLTACNSISTSSPLLNIVAGGGGQSSCVDSVSDNSGSITCQIASYTNASIPGWPKPAYQPVATGSGLTVGNDLTRDVPDIAMFSADGLVSNSFYIVCDSDLTGGPCNLSQSLIDFVGVGGTSSSAPAFAGMMALVNQNITLNHPTLSPRQGNANYVLYALANSQSLLACNSSSSPNAQCTFNDVTKGNNSVPCAAGSFQCSDQGVVGFGVVETGVPANTPSYTAGTGFDAATGLGSINAFNLVSNWPTEVGSFTPTTTSLCLSKTTGACTPAAISITHGTPVYVNIAVTTTSSGAPPASTSAKPEDVALIGTFTGGATQGVDRFDPNTGNADIYSLASGGTLTGASTNELVGGTYTVSARYGGDGVFGSSTSTPGISVTVAPENSTTTVSVFTTSSANTLVTVNPVPYGAFNTIRADVKGATSGLETGTGTVTLNDNGAAIVTPFDTTSSSFPLNTEGYTEDQTTFLAVGMHSFTATYGGDASYNPSVVSAAVPLTVTQGSTTTTIHSSATSVMPGTNFTLNAVVDTQSSVNPSGGSYGLPPSGMVTFFAGTTSLGSVSVSAVAPGDVNGFDESIATLATAHLSATGTITAVYSGDTNYSTSTSAGVVVAVNSGGTFSLNAGNNGVMSVSMPGGQPPASDTVTVTGSGGFSGTVTLTVASVLPSSVDPPSCSFGSTGTITLNAAANPPVNSGVATLTCNTIAAGALVVKPAGRPWIPNGLLTLEIGTTLACIFLLGISGRKRRGLVLLGMALLAVVIVGTSCGSSGGSGVNIPGTTPGAYTVTVTATPSSGSAQQTMITLNVGQ